MQWRVMSGAALHFHSWNDEFVVYNSLSGDTHLLGETAAHILLKLQQTPTDATALIESMASLADDKINDEIVVQVEQILADLDKLALIERA